MKRLLASLLLSTSALPAHADIVSTTGLIPITPSNISVAADFLSNNGLPAQVIFAEQQGVTLGSALTTDTGIIPAGTVVNSYIFAVNVFDCCANISANTSVTFDGPVLGVVFNENIFGVPSANYALTNFLGLPGLSYGDLQTCLYCAFEVLGNQQGAFLDNISINGNTIDFHNAYSTPGDIARIITEHNPVPAPIAGAGIPGFLAALLAWFGYRRRKRNDWLGLNSSPEYRG